MLQGVLARVRASLASFAAGGADIAARLKVADWLRVLRATLVWAGATLLALPLALLRWLGRFFAALLVPKSDAPFDILKHYGSAVGVVIGFGALIWAVFQILHPPLVITVNKLPGQLESESWLNPELSRTLMDQLERIRAVVKDERNPAFEAVINPPNIVVKTGDWSLNVQEQILTPLGTLLGRGQGEVHLAVTCFHPGCARTSDPECREQIKGDDKREQQYLCLRLTADIQRGQLHRRVISQFALSNETYDLNMARQMSRIAEAVTSTADPATAALYFYRRVRQEGDAIRSVTYDPEVISELRGQAFKAAEQAEVHDTVSACWAHSVRAHLAIDGREFSLAEVYIARAKNMSFWDHLRHSVDCDRLIATAEAELARRLARPGTIISYPPHPDDDDKLRLPAAHRRIVRLLEQHNAAWAGFVRNRIDSADLKGALEYTQAEIDLAWFTEADQCALLDAQRPPRESVRATDGALEKIRAETRPVVRQAIERLQNLSPAQPLPPLTRLAAMNFLELFSANDVCPEGVQAVGRQIYLAHPSDPLVTRSFARVTETLATKKSRNLGHPAVDADRGNPILGYAKSLYERLLDIAEDKVDVIALSRLAYITEAFYADGLDANVPPWGPIPETLSNVKRAWKRYQQHLYPTDTRYQAEFLVTFWGSLLVRFYPALLDADLLGGGETQDAGMRSLKANFAEFSRALHFLFPTARPANLADLPKLPDGVGTRIGRLCMLSYAVYRNELADFLIDRINKWRNLNSDLSECYEDLIPEAERETFLLTNEAQETMRRRRGDAEYRLNAAKSKAQELLGAAEAAGQEESRKVSLRADASALQASIPDLEKAFERADQVAEKARQDAVAPRRNWEKKKKDVNDSIKLCRFRG